MAEMLSANEHGPLLPQTPHRQNNDQTKKGRGKFWGMCICTIWTILLGSSASIGWYAYKLTTEVDGLEQNVTYLEAQVEAQENVIRRFNNSVSNQDVVDELQVVKANLQATQQALNDQLVAVENRVKTELDSTVKTLDDTVVKAQAEINDEVEKVKSDVSKYVAFTQDQFNLENSFMIYQLAGTFTLLGCLISMWHMTAHLRSFTQPFIQRKIMAILWMCPIYSITSWLALVFVSLEGYLGIIRDCYEAYAIYMFLSFLIAVLGKGDRNVVVDVLTEHADHLPIPFGCGCCYKNATRDNPHSLASAVLFQCQLFTMQFVLLKPFTAIASFVLTKYDYPTTNNDYHSPQFYIFLVENFSIFLAFTGLLKFYHAVDEELSWCSPLPKFLCIKGVVFMTFWQGLVISILASTTEGASMFQPAFDDDSQTATGETNYSDSWATQAQNFLICLEMLIFSIAHFYVFPTEEWRDGYRPKKSEAKFGDNLALRDFLSDLKLIVRGVKPKSKKHKYRKGRNDESKENLSIATTINEEDDSKFQTPLVENSSDPPSRDDSSVAKLFENMSEDERKIATEQILPNIEKVVEELDLEEKRQLSESINGSSNGTRGSNFGDISGINESTGLLHASVFTKNGSVTNTPLSLSSHASNYNPTAGRMSFLLTAEDQQEALRMLAVPSEGSIANDETSSVAESTSGYPSISSIADEDYDEIDRSNSNITPPPAIVRATADNAVSVATTPTEEAALQQGPTPSSFVPIPVSPPPLPPTSAPSSPP